MQEHEMPPEMSRLEFLSDDCLAATAPSVQATVLVTASSEGEIVELTRSRADLNAAVRSTNTRTLRERLLAVICCFGFTFLTGCMQSTEKTSNFELDHVIAPHWPRDVEDLEEKLRSRIQVVEANSDPAIFQEIVDLIEWAPEIAADSYLPEEEWNTVNLKCEEVFGNLRSASLPLSKEHIDMAVNLCDVLAEVSPSALENPLLQPNEQKNERERRKRWFALTHGLEEASSEEDSNDEAAVQVPETSP